MSYRDEFDTIWTAGLCDDGLLKDYGIAWSDSGAVLILIDLDPPDRSMDKCLQGVNLRQHLTAFSWAAAWRLKFPLAKARVLLVGGSSVGTPSDLLSKLVGGREASGKPMLAGLGWLEHLSLVRILDWLRQRGIEPDGNNDSAVTLIRSVVWAGLLADPENRHSLSNVLGVFILRERFEPTQRSTLRTMDYHAALLSLLTTMREVRSPTVVEGGTETVWFSEKERRGFVRQFFLIDDMMSLWYPVLALALGLDYKRPAGWNMIAKPDLFPDGRSLVDGLKDSHGKPLVRVPVKDSFPDGSVLFLDLRLFSTRPLEEEFRFLASLLALARQESENNAIALGLVWPGFNATELNQMAEALRFKRRDGDGYYLLLALLPRLLSQFDPTLPIVLFSSTRQRIIAEALKAHGNIITEFSKPMLFTAGDSDETIEQTRFRFVRAMRKAVGIAKTRSIFANLGELNFILPSFKAPFPLPQRPVPKEQKPLIELYVDESGTTNEQHFTIGCLVLIHENIARGTEFHATIERRWCFGTSDFTGPGDSVNLSKNPKSKTKRDVMDFVLGQTSRPYFCACALGSPSEKQAENLQLPALFNESNADNRYRALLEQLVETILYDHAHVREVLTNGAVLRIEVATRRSADVTFDQVERFRRLFGTVAQIDDESGRPFYYSLQSDDVFPIIKSIIGRRGWEPNSVLETARGVSLGYEIRQVNPRRPPVPHSQVHFLADWIAKEARRAFDGAALLPEFAELFEKGFLQEKTGGFQHWTRATVEANRKSYDRAILAAQPELTTGAPLAVKVQDIEQVIHGVPTAIGWMSSGGENWRKKISGSQLLALFNKV